MSSQPVRGTGKEILDKRPAAEREAEKK